MPKQVECPEIVKGEFDFLRYQLLHIEKPKKPNISNMAKLIAKENGLSVAGESLNAFMHKTRRFINNQNEPSIELVEYLYKYLLKEGMGADWIKNQIGKKIWRNAYWGIDKNKKDYDIWANSASSEQIKTGSNQQENENLIRWYANLSPASEITVQETLKAELAENEEFMEVISDLADALKKGYATEGEQKRVISLVNMNDLDKDAAGCYTYSGYQFYTDFTVWVQVNPSPTNRLLDDKLPQKLFGEYAKTIVQRRNALSRPAFPEGACLSKFLGLSSQSVYLPIILLSAFTADTTDENENPLSLMSCYASYDNESTNLTHKSYAMTSREWWIDAFDEDRRKDFVWDVKTKNATHFKMGSSRAFSSVRKNMPNERGLWLDIDLSDTPQYRNAKLILSIQLARKTPNFLL